MTDERLDILGVTADEAIAWCADRGIGRGSALAAYCAAYRDGATPPAWARCDLPPVGAQHVEDETTKFTLRLADGLDTESVIIPMRQRGSGGVGGRGGDVTTRTLCVSSQVGCAMGCRFCETAQMGLMRNLTPAEIIAQWYAARHTFAAPIKNIVFMGMGEPMDNLDAVLQAIRILADHHGPAIAPTNIAVSTVGRAEGIRRLAEFAAQLGFRRLNLAVSVNAPNDAIRSSIMPINRATPMAELMDAMLAFPKRPAASLCIEYVLIPGVNDADAHADELVAYLQPLRCTVNVIPYNPRRDSPWPAPAEADVERFIARVRSHGQFVKRRTTKGRTVMAACGQLGNPAIRRRKFVDLTAPTGTV